MTDACRRITISADYSIPLEGSKNSCHPYLNMLESAPMSARLILVNGTVYTQDEVQPRATAIVLQGDTIAYVGDDDTARRMRAHDDEVIDLAGRLVLPAFTDAHIHLTAYAQGLDTLQLDGCRSLEEVLDRVRARVAETAPGVLIRGRGWNHTEWSIPLWPDRCALDAVAPQNPVILFRKDGHSAWLNSPALRQAGITRATAPPSGGVIDRDADGEPSGILRENALQLLGETIGASTGEIVSGILPRAIAHAHRAGLATICNVEDVNALRAFQSLHEQGQLTLRVVHSLPPDKIEQASQIRQAIGLGGEWLRLQAVKLFADGSLGSATAELRAPFIGQGENRGVAVTSSETLLHLARAAALAQLDVWTHAIGDYAITRVLDVYARLRQEGFGERVLRIEHVQHLDPSDLPRFAHLNVIASMQPLHQPSDMRMADALLGRARARYSYAFCSLYCAGATLAFGSDCPVERLEPLYGIHAAVTRQNILGEPPEGWYPEERITVAQSVRAYTLGAAAATNDVARAGSLTLGKRADVVVLAENIFRIPAHEIWQTPVDYTIVGGRIVYARN